MMSIQPLKVALAGEKAGLNTGFNTSHAYAYYKPLLMQMSQVHVSG